MTTPETPTGSVNMDLYNPDAHAEARRNAGAAIAGVEEVLIDLLPATYISSPHLRAEAILSAFYELKYTEAYTAAAVSPEPVYPLLKIVK